MAVTISNRSLSANFTTTGGDVTGTSGAAVGDLVLVLVLASGKTGTFGISDTGTGGTYTSIATCLEATSVDQATLFVRDTFSPAATLSMTTTGLTGSTGGGFGVVTIAGLATPGIAAIRAFGNQDNRASSGGFPTVTLNKAAQNTNPMVGWLIGTNVTSTNGPTGWSNASGNSIATPAFSHRCAFITTGFTAGATVAWTTNVASTTGGIAVEVLATPVIHPEFPALQAVNRSAVFMRAWSRRVKQDWRRRDSGLLVPGMA